MAANVTDVFVEHIQRWLDEEMKKDAQLAEKVHAGSKTVEMACNYVLSEVKKSGRCGFDDAEVYGMVRHFFDGDDLPEIDKEVIALLDNGKVVFSHRPNPEGWDAKSIITEKVERYIPETYGKGGWNIPDVKWWLDCSMPKEIEL